MYFSKVTLRDTAKYSLELLYTFRDYYTIHRAIWRLFAYNEIKERDFIYRVDQIDGIPVAYIVSDRVPKMDDPLWHVQTKDYGPRLQSGMRLAFDLKANPVVSRHNERGKVSRHDVVMDEKKRLASQGGETVRKPLYQVVHEQSLKWLESRTEGHGFLLDGKSVRVDSYTQHNFRKKGDVRVSLSTVNFRGILKVTDPARFLDTLRDGIGPAKGLGCGMMLIKRA